MVMAQEITLFDFNFEPVHISDEEISEAFALLVQRVKERGNYYSFNGIETQDIKKYFDYFIEKGWIVKGQIRCDLLEYHTIGEVLEKIEEYVDELLKRPHETIVYHDDTWRTWDKFIPCRFHADHNKSQMMKKVLYIKLQDIKKRVAMTLGLKHYLECPKSRGSEMNSFSDKGYRKHLIPFLAKKVAEINDFDEMKSFFDHSFLVGRRDEIWGECGLPIPPYPEIQKIMVNELQIAALTEANEKNAKEVLKLVLKHCGKAYLSIDFEFKSDNVIFPPTYSKEDYYNSLSADDLFLITADIERLKKLHGRWE